MKKNDLETVLQFACCESGEERFCKICPWNGTKKCEENDSDLDALYEAIKNLTEEYR